MKNYVIYVVNDLERLISDAIVALKQAKKIPADLSVPIIVEHSRSKQYGDFATNVAMLIAGKVKEYTPLIIAELIVAEMQSQFYLARIEVLSPGFINFYFTKETLLTVIKDIITAHEQYGHTNIGQGKMVNVEFVSANPTGPLHVGHGRSAAYGDVVANLLETMGYKVHREYYVNDAGRQMHVLALSIWLRYLELGGEDIYFPASGYKGEYVIDIARRIRVEYGELFRRPLAELYEDLPADQEDGGNKEFYVDALVARAQSLLGEKDYATIFQIGVGAILTDIHEDLEEFGVTFQEWFHESHLIKNNDAASGIDKLYKLGHVYEKDGALWFRATDFGDEKDRVLVRSNGEITYFASDVGYHLNKYERAFDLIIDVFGADHHGYAPRIKGFLEAMNLDFDKLKILLVQFAILYRGKTKVPMSTRSGKFVTLRELREEVGNDAARFFYIMRKSNQHLDFDMELAKSQSADNPVYYIQYAHARICSVMRQLVERGLDFEVELGLEKLALLKTPQEENLLRRLWRYSTLLQTAALNYEPHLLAHYLRELATDFHTYYNAMQFLVDDVELRNARLCLIDAVRIVLANGLNSLGVSAPEAM